MSALMTTTLSGYATLKTPSQNKGTSFTYQERSELGMTGLIPGGSPLSLETKVIVTMELLRSKATPLDKYILLQTIQDSDETLYYALLTRHTTECMPLVNQINI